MYVNGIFKWFLSKHLLGLSYISRWSIDFIYIKINESKETIWAEKSMGFYGYVLLFWLRRLEFIVWMISIQFLASKQC